MSYKEKIIKILKEANDWVPGYKLININTEYGWIGSSSSRRLRELAEKGMLERKIDNKYVWYRINRDKFKKFDYYADGKKVGEGYEGEQRNLI